ncbi:FAD dependent oxidoreductase [Sideroxydans lithotrophicus ES-1]|uniref:FAD dependent oxidoreductase n=1 Tax=Sideroxydans lithotrophicus (strain ES-1) TaxID=580332 RepID=D5CMQ9_SIDLE|nr:FAD dependent oxidoreductase [Sideroxydans lithotrophicus ES-1]
MAGVTLAKAREYGKRGSGRNYGTVRNGRWLGLPGRAGYSWTLRMLPLV